MFGGKHMGVAAGGVWWGAESGKGVVPCSAVGELNANDMRRRLPSADDIMGTLLLSGVLKPSGPAAVVADRRIRVGDTGTFAP